MPDGCFRNAAGSCVCPAATCGFRVHFTVLIVLSEGGKNGLDGALSYDSCESAFLQLSEREAIVAPGWCDVHMTAARLLFLHLETHSHSLPEFGEGSRKTRASLQNWGHDLHCH